MRSPHTSGSGSGETHLAEEDGQILPGNGGHVVEPLRKAPRRRQRLLYRSTTVVRSDLKATDYSARMVGTSAPMQRLYGLMKRAAQADISILIRGESGTGKELVARSLHFNGRRRIGPFLAVNCAAVPEALIESELFGHEAGAFTGATRTRVGIFERAAGGDDPARRDRRHAAGAAGQAVARTGGA